MKLPVATRIRHRILAGDYRPGAPLVQATLAAELGVGKAPVREALVHLRAEGLIDDYANRGFKVRVPVELHTRRHIEEARADLTRFVELGSQAP